MYPGWPPMQQQGVYGMNTGQRVVDHGGYPMTFGMMSQQQQQQHQPQQQMGYWSAPHLAMPNHGRMRFVASFSPNDVYTDPQIISNVNSHAGMNQYPTGMINRAQQQLVRMSPNFGGAIVTLSSTGANPRPTRPFHPLVDSGRSPNPGGEHNPAMIAANKPGSIIPHMSPDSDTSWPMLSSISGDSRHNYQFAPHQQTRFEDPSLPGPSSRWTANSAPFSARSQVIITYVLLNFIYALISYLGCDKLCLHLKSCFRATIRQLSFVDLQHSAIICWVFSLLQ